MRILPRLPVPTRKAARRLWRQSKAHLNLRRVYYSVEIAVFIAIYLIVFSGQRLRTIDAFGQRTDAFATLFLIVVFIVVHDVC